MKKHHLIFALILFLTFLFRLPSLFEPFWYGDEGIFAAVARNLNQGGVLYQTGWDNKPPMIYLTYQAIFKFFGVSMFWLRLLATIGVMITAVIIYEIGQSTLGIKRALSASFIFGFLTSLRLIEGNLALTEIFMILPISAAILVVIKRKFDYPSAFLAGFLIAVGSLYKQVGVLEAAALGIFLFLISKNFIEFFKKGLVLTFGFILPYAVTLAYFAPKNLVGDYIFAAYTYYQIYFEESPRYAILINIAKYLPIVAAVVYGVYKKLRQKEVGVTYLFFLWAAFSFLGSYFSGRTYGHYLVQAVGPLSLLLASINLTDFKIAKPIRLYAARTVFALSFFLPLLFLTRLLFADFLSGGPLSQVKYWRNFLEFASGQKNLNDYNDFFDKNVNTIMALADFLRDRKADGQNVYIWGDYPWLYAVADLKNPTRYVTSFHVFGVPDGRGEVIESITKNPPIYIIKPTVSIGYFRELEEEISKKYTYLFNIEDSQVFAKTK